MKDWSYRFEPVSKAAWVKQIERELKGRPLQSLHAEWWPGAPLDPIHHADDHTPRVHLPAYLFESPPSIIEPIDGTGKSANELNKIILLALRFGVDTIALKADQVTADQTDVWLSDVYADMINWHILLTDPGIVLHALEQHAAGKVHYQIQMDHSKDEGLFQPTNAANYQWCYQIASEGNWVDDTAAMFNRILRDAKTYSTLTGRDDFLDHCVLQAEADEEYLKCIIQLRTLHIVWQNLTGGTATGNARRKYLECHIQPTESDGADHYLIRATTSAMAACLSGVTGICIHPIPAAAAHYERINRNIHHLLHMESGLPKGTDPLAGAYAIDHYTALWATAIWDQLNTG